MFSDFDHSAMRAAMEEARKAAARDDVPIGAVLVRKGSERIEAAFGNETRARKDPTAHAEILCIRAVCAAVGAQRIPDYDLYVTLEPCTMCAAAIAFARIPRLIFAARDEKGGGVMHGARFFDQPTCHHKINVFEGLLAEESSKMLKDYFSAKR